MMGRRIASSPTSVIGLSAGLWASASLTAATTSLGPKSPPIASTAIRPGDPGAMAAVLPPLPSGGLDLDVEDLAAPVGARLRVHAVRADQASVGRVAGELGRDESVCCTAVCATALGLLAFWIGHLEGG